MTPSTILLYICFSLFGILFLVFSGYLVKLFHQSRKLKVSSNNLYQQRRKKPVAIPLKTEEMAYDLAKTGNS